MAALVGLLMLATSWSNIVGLEREGTAADAEHSVDQRKVVRLRVVADVSATTRCSASASAGSTIASCRTCPIARKTSSSNRSARCTTTTRCSACSTETGSSAWPRSWRCSPCGRASAWRLAQANRVCRDGSEHHGVLMLALLANYLCSAMFHDLTLLPSQQLLLFAFAGLTVNLRQRQSMSAAVIDTSSRQSPIWPRRRAILRQLTSRLQGVPATTSTSSACRSTRITMSEATVAESSAGAASRAAKRAATWSRRTSTMPCCSNIGPTCAPHMPTRRSCSPTVRRSCWLPVCSAVRCPNASPAATWCRDFPSGRRSRCRYSCSAPRQASPKSRPRESRINGAT